MTCTTILPRMKGSNVNIETFPTRTGPNIRSSRVGYCIYCMTSIVHLHVERLHLQIVVRFRKQMSHYVGTGVAAQHRHFVVLAGASSRTVIDEETLDGNAVQIGILNRDTEQGWFISRGKGTSNSNTSNSKRQDTTFHWIMRAD